MTNGIKRLAEIFEQHAKIIRNEEQPLLKEYKSYGKRMVILRLCHDLFTEVMDEGLVKEWDCEEEGHSIDHATIEKLQFGNTGETVERNGYCEHCNTPMREVWIHSCDLEGHQ